ncbi:G-protein coupled receptor 4-like [Thunnus maccoyii]|uniref:G-protein coupled receptor 4-like n=1 Tax=Thunnus maccoyii TaxID=8240 RepID=UPI001C4B615F|nr:G-protein coupled receptor 4-like [Thunnus maccoyii]
MNATTTSTATILNSTQCVDIGASAISDLKMAVYILAFIFGLIFNVLMLGPIFREVQRQNVMGIFLLNLSLSDMLYLFTIPLWINYYRQDHHWNLGVMSCGFAGFFYYSNMYISIYLLCCISVHRCLVVTYPHRSKTHRTSYYAWTQCAIVHVVVVVLHIVWLIYDNLKDTHDEENNNDRCYETYPMQRPVALFNLLRVGFGFLLPLLVLTVCYWKILATVGQRPHLNAQAKRKVRMLSFGVIGIFSICYAPYHIILLARSLVFYQSDNTQPDGSYCQFEQKMHFFFSCTLALSSLNCVMDPLLYVFVGNGVQKEVTLCWRRNTGTEREDCVLTRHSRGKPNSN